MSLMELRLAAGLATENMDVRARGVGLIRTNRIRQPVIRWNGL
jgi:hypothetical protein